MNKLKKSFNNKGIILLEALIALTVIVIVMTALVTALISSLNSTTYSNQQTVATALAQEGIDIARDQKNADFAYFYDNLNSDPVGHCLGAGEITIPGSDCTDIDGIYSRRIYINNSGQDRRNGNTDTAGDCESSSIFVASVVTWSDSRCSGAGKCHEVELSSCFANLNDLGL